MKGLFGVNKPCGLTSFDVVRIIRRATREKRVGHGGSLDPFADGVLVIAVGKEYTRQLNLILNHSQKEYRAEILLGVSSDTYDITGTCVSHVCPEPPARAAIDAALAQFTGEILQSPPPYSAKKISGTRACDLIRQGAYTDGQIKAMLKPKKVVIERIDVLSYAFPKMEVNVVCSSGVYLRSLAHDLGAILRCGGVLSALTRTRVGKFTLEDSHRLEEFGYVAPGTGTHA